MADFRHPVTGVQLNVIEVRHGPVSDKERETAKLLLADGLPRWVVAAMLGRFPLAFTGTGAKPGSNRRGKIGGGLSVRDAARDPRQIGMDTLYEDFFTDLFGPDHPTSD